MPRFRSIIPITRSKSITSPTSTSGGKILNPLGLLQQVQGAVIQGLGPILREEMVFEDGRVSTSSFVEYEVPRFADLVPMDIFLLDRSDLDPAGAGETPLISVAPAITNAVSKAIGQAPFDNCR